MNIPGKRSGGVLEDVVIVKGVFREDFAVGTIYGDLKWTSGWRIKTSDIEEIKGGFIITRDTVYRVGYIRGEFNGKAI